MNLSATFIPNSFFTIVKFQYFLIFFRFVEARTLIKVICTLTKSCLPPFPHWPLRLDVEFESTFMPAAPRSTSVAPHRIINPLPLVCWPACQKWNRG